MLKTILNISEMSTVYWYYLISLPATQSGIFVHSPFSVHSVLRWFDPSSNLCIKEKQFVFDLIFYKKPAWQKWAGLFPNKRYKIRYDPQELKVNFQYKICFRVASHFYRPHPKDGEGNVFSPSTPGGWVPISHNALQHYPECHGADTWGVPCQVQLGGGTLPRGEYPAWRVPCQGGTLPGGVPCGGVPCPGGYPVGGATLPGGVPR